MNVGHLDSLTGLTESLDEEIQKRLFSLLIDQADIEATTGKARENLSISKYWLKRCGRLTNAAKVA
jgi:hypothetical protein